ncbi:zinc-binding dehydrogenase [Oerskovia sp. M15]
MVALAGGPAKVDLVRSLATPGTSAQLTAIDYTTAGWLDVARAATTTAGRDGATLVVDGVAGQLGADAASLLAASGRLLMIGWSSGQPNAAARPDAASAVDVTWAVGPDAPPWGDLFTLQERALALAADGTWRVLTHQVPLAEAARAHRELESRATSGKVVLV